MIIEHHEHLLKSGYNQFALEAYIETLKKGFAPTFIIPYTYDDHIIICKNDIEIIGIICFWYTEWDETASVRIGYVKEGFTRRGIYTKMYSKMKEVLKDMGAKRIYSGISNDNVAMNKCAISQGRKLIAHLYLDEL